MSRSAKTKELCKVEERLQRYTWREDLVFSPGGQMFR